MSERSFIHAAQRYPHPRELGAGGGLGEAEASWVVPGEAASALNWYVVQVKPRQENRVVRHLAVAALPTFLPFIEVIRRRRAVRTSCLEPLFPGYLFIRLGPVDQGPGPWSTVRWTPGVSRILSAGETPVPVPEEFMQGIENRMREHGFVRPASTLVNGAKVRVRSGPFEDIEAVFDRPLSRSGRVRVLLQLMGQPMSVEIDEDYLEPA